MRRASEPVDTEAAVIWERLVAGSDREQLAAFIAIGACPAAEGVSRITIPLLRSYQRRGLTVRDARGVHTLTDLGRRVAAVGRSCDGRTQR
jgi:hypothetical protein